MEAERSIGQQQSVPFDTRLLAETLSREFPKAASDLLGFDTRSYWPATARAELEAHLNKTLPLFAEIEQINGEPEPPQRALKIFDLVDRLFKSGTLRIPQNIHTFDWLAEWLHDHVYTVTPPEFSTTSYRDYLRALNRLLRDLERTGRLFMAHNFLEEFLTVEGPFIMQPVIRTGKNEKVLHLLSGTAPTFEDAELLVTFYRELSALYEKLLAIPLGCVYLLDDRMPEWPLLRDSLLGKKMAVIEHDPRMKIFAAGFDRFIRNALSHGDVQYLAAQRTILFRHGEDRLLLTARGLMRKCREAAALVFVLFLAPQLIMYHQFKAFSSLRARLLEATSGRPHQHTH